MRETEAGGQEKQLVLEYELNASPEKVWRAISIPAFREKWLPTQNLIDSEPVSTTPGEEVCYRMRDDESPFLESVVTFQVLPDLNGGAILRIVHELADTRLAAQMLPAANSNMPSLMRAA
ncbi:SRPBCC family protein [Xanthobacter sp. TB0136]|uniref:SRPBCC family protein n=1 Tax=Xanthobacter sp. TB0136 TaxID=3459177 RepID=UPI004039239D